MGVRAWVLSCLVSVALALPQRPLPSLLDGSAVQNQQNQFQVRSDDDVFSIEVEDLQFGKFNCPPGQFRHGARCVLPKINRNIFVFGREEEPEPTPTINVRDLPEVELDYNIIFVKTKTPKPVKPVVLPPNPKKTIVYVLEDQPDNNPEIIQAPESPQDDPEVYYVKVGPGENPVLHGTDVDLNAAYNQALQNTDLDDIEVPLDLTLGSRRGGDVNNQAAGAPNLANLPGFPGAAGGLFNFDLDDSPDIDATTLLQSALLNSGVNSGADGGRPAGGRALPVIENAVPTAGQ